MINEILQKVEKVLEKHGEIIFAYLYGSLAKGEGRRSSDIDIGVFLKKDFKKDVFYEAQLALEIEKEAKLEGVEVVVLNGKSLRFLNQVLRYGKLITSRNEKERIKFETFVTKSYIDFKPYYEEYDRLRAKRLGL
jgi:predicted nucleotidyltransferase